MGSGQNRRVINSDLGEKASVCLCPSHTLHLSHTARPQLQAAEHWFHKSYVPETFTHSFFPKSHFSECKSGQNLNVKFPGMFYGANTELSAPIIQPPIFLISFEWSELFGT